MSCRCKLMVVLGVILMSCTVSAQNRLDLPRIVVLAPSVPADQMQAFEQGLQDLGHIDGSTVSIVHYSAQGREAQLAELAQEAIALKPKVIVAIGGKAGRVARLTTQDIPIVVVTGDITAEGLVKNLARPEGNIIQQCFRYFPDMLVKANSYHFLGAKQAAEGTARGGEESARIPHWISECPGFDHCDVSPLLNIKCGRLATFFRRVQRQARPRRRNRNPNWYGSRPPQIQGLEEIPPGPEARVLV